MAPTPTPGQKPHMKLASRLVFAGVILFGLEKFGLSRIEGPGKSFHLDPNVLSLLVLVPIGLVVAGAIVFMVGRMRRR